MYDLAVTNLVDKEKMIKIFRNPVKFTKLFLGLDLRPYQIKVLLSCIKSNRIAVRMARQMGKSTVVAVFCLYWCFFKKNQHIVIVSKSHNQAKLLFDKIRELTSHSPYVSSKMIKDFVTELSFDNGSSIKALPSGITGDTIRGHDANIIIMEESAFIPDEIVDNVVRPMAGAKHDNKIIQISTPVGHNHFYDCFKDNSGYVTHHFSYVDGEACGHYASGFIEEMRKSMPQVSFKREYDSEFVEEEDSAFSWRLVSQGIQPDLNMPGEFNALPVPRMYSIGFDVGRYTSSAVFTIVEMDNGVEKFVYYKELSNVPWETQFEYLIQMCLHILPNRVLIDATPGSMGGPLAERFASDKRTKNFNLIPFTFSMKSKYEMANNFIRKIESGLLKYPNDKRFLDQCINQRSRPSGGGSVRVYSAPSNSRDDILWSLMMAIWERQDGEVMAYSRRNK